MYMHCIIIYYQRLQKKNSFSFLLLDAVCKEILSDYLQSINFKVQL